MQQRQYNTKFHWENAQEASTCRKLFNLYNELNCCVVPCGLETVKLLEIATRFTPLLPRYLICITHTSQKFWTACLKFTFQSWKVLRGPNKLQSPTIEGWILQSVCCYCWMHTNGREAKYEGATSVRTWSGMYVKHLMLEDQCLVQTKYDSSSLFSWSNRHYDESNDSIPQANCMH